MKSHKLDALSKCTETPIIYPQRVWNPNLLKSETMTEQLRERALIFPARPRNKSPIASRKFPSAGESKFHPHSVLREGNNSRTASSRAGARVPYKLTLLIFQKASSSRSMLAAGVDGVGYVHGTPTVWT